MIKFLRSIFAWRTAWESDVWAYEENKVTGERRAWRTGWAYEAPDRVWLQGGSAKW